MTADHGGMELWVLLPMTAVFVVLFYLVRNELVRRVLRCPVKNADAEVEIVQRAHDPTKPIRVKTCSLLTDPKRVDCGQDCIHQPV